jgi:hypothetical protein
MAQNAQGKVLGHVTDLGVDFHASPNGTCAVTRPSCG